MNKFSWVFASFVLLNLSAYAHMPIITGTPVVDSPAVLEWPLDTGVKKLSLHNPTSNLLYDLHGAIDQCDLVLSTEGNYHMALKDLWPVFLAKVKDDNLHNVVYTTSPPIVVQQIGTGSVQFDNLTVGCRPSVAVASATVIHKLVDQGAVDGDPRPLYSDRGVVLLVKKGNPKHLLTVWDLGKQNVHLVTPNHVLEKGAYSNYQTAIYNIALKDPHPPQGWTADKLINVIFNSTSGDKFKWLEGPRIHHRDEPWSVAYGKADAAVILYHLGRYIQESFPDTFDVVSLGGSLENPVPLPGTPIVMRYVAALKGDWTPKQLAARDALMALFVSSEFRTILEKRGLTANF